MITPERSCQDAKTTSYSGETSVQSQHTAQWAEFIADPDWSIPVEVTVKIKQHILDTLGVQIACATLPWSQTVLDYALSRPHQGPAQVTLNSVTMDPAIAAFLNGTFAHGFEMDDTEMRTASHPGVVVVPTGLAIGQSVQATGEELLRAVTIGYEIMVRVGLAAPGMMARGFHSTAVTGAIGAAATTAFLLRLSPTQIANSLGIAASMASGITEYAVSGGSVKRVHAGWAARSGIEAAYLAREGITAPQKPLEGQRGLLRALSDQVDATRLTEGLGTFFELLTTGLKPYSCCAAQHTVLDAMTDLRAQFQSQTGRELSGDDISSIKVQQRHREVSVVGQTTRPVDITSAQFSAAYGIALNVVHGANSFHTYLDSSVTDPELLQLADLVQYETFEKKTDVAGDAPAVVSLHLADGQQWEKTVQYARGSVQRPLSQDEVTKKFRDLTLPVIGAEYAERILELIGQLDHVADIQNLGELLAGPEPS